MEFVGRERELALLREHLDRPGAGLFVLFGRRRIGKTALLQRALEGRTRTAYFVATRSTATEELRRLSDALASQWDVPLLAAQPLASPEAWMAFLEGVTGPAILALDEFPCLVESMPSLAGLLQAAWDGRLARGNLKIVVLGSAVGMMEQSFLSPRSPLFGRRTGQLRLGPLGPEELSPAFPGPLVDRIELAALFGGVPGYLQRLDPDDTLARNLERRVLTPGEPLYEEVPFLLREELREPRVYQSVLAAIAAGSRKFGEISSKVGLDRANLSRYLSVLADLGMVEREVPVTERQPDKSRKGLYRLADPFLDTWYAFVHGNRNDLERGRVEEVFANRVMPRLHHHLSRAVEPVLRRLFVESGLAAQAPFPIAMSGRHWSPTAEFDLVLLDEERRRAFVAEVKWSREPVPRTLLDDLRGRVSREADFTGMDVTLAIVSRSGFRGRRGTATDERLIDLSSM